MNRRSLLGLLTAACALAAVAPLTGCAKSDNLKSLTVDEVEAKINAKDGKTFVYDNNENDRYKRSHLPGAKWLDYEKVAAADLPADKSATLVFYCASEL